MTRSWHSLLVLLILVCSIASPGQQGLPSSQKEQNAGPAWLEMERAIAKMHGGMAFIKPSGDEDADFARLMVSHHEAALDMAKAELMYGKDPHMRRLAQEIVTDQQSEIELMQLWLKRHESGSPKVVRSGFTFDGGELNVKIIRWLSILCFVSFGFVEQAPWGRADIPVSAHDRVYAADQTSNTVSVIDPSHNTLLGVIKLGDPIPGALSPLYRGELLVHGLGYSPDSKTLAVVAVGSRNSVTLIDTATNAIKGKVYVGRSPHEPFFTPDGRELWVTVRGENYVSVIDPGQVKEVRRIELANGPGMTMFGPDGKYAFVWSGFVPELAVIEVASHQVIKRLPQSSPFCPNISVSPENDEVWITLKDVGKVQVFSAQPPFDQKAVLETGPITNHVNFVNNRNGKFAYVTIGGANEVKAFRRGAKPNWSPLYRSEAFLTASGLRAMVPECMSR